MNPLGKDPTWCMLEPYINGGAGQPYRKYSSNTGFVRTASEYAGDPGDAVQAFSHFSHHVTRGGTMVVDNQGVFDPKGTGGSGTYNLTDPALHCLDSMRFG